jgi:hypothetical protein
LTDRAVAPCSCLCDNGGCTEEDEDRSFGPCAREPRKTLLQWSYGTSFGGGPPGPDEPLATDRPDFTEASTTVGLGVVQIESGYTYVFNRDGGLGSRTHSFPEILARIGVFAEWIEFRVFWNFIDETVPEGNVLTHQSGPGDLQLAFKIGLTPQEGLLPEMALTPQMFVPSGEHGLSGDEVLPGLNWLYGWELSENFTLAGSTQANRALDDNGMDHHLLLAQSMTVGATLTESFGGYVEWFGIFPHGATTILPVHFLNGGLTYRLTNDIQVDIRTGVGLNDDADDYFLGVGNAVRF